MFPNHCLVRARERATTTSVSHPFLPHCDLHTLTRNMAIEGHANCLHHSLRCKAGEYSERYVVDIIWWQRRRCCKRGNTSY